MYTKEARSRSVTTNGKTMLTSDASLIVTMNTSQRMKEILVLLMRTFQLAPVSIAAFPRKPGIYYNAPTATSSHVYDAVTDAGLKLETKLTAASRAARS